MGVADEEELVYDARNGAADERAKPVDPVVGPDPADDSRPEGDRRVHGGAVESAADENVRAENEPYSERPKRPDGSPLRVNRRRVDSVDQPESQHHFQDHGAPHARIL